MEHRTLDSLLQDIKGITEEVASLRGENNKLKAENRELVDKIARARHALSEPNVGITPLDEKEREAIVKEALDLFASCRHDSSVGTEPIIKDSNVSELRIAIKKKYPNWKVELGLSDALVINTFSDLTFTIQSTCGRWIIHVTKQSEPSSFMDKVVWRVGSVLEALKELIDKYGGKGTFDNNANENLTELIITPSPIRELNDNIKQKYPNWKVEQKSYDALVVDTTDDAAFTIRYDHEKFTIYACKPSDSLLYRTFVRSNIGEAINALENYINGHKVAMSSNEVNSNKATGVSKDNSGDNNDTAKGGTSEIKDVDTTVVVTKQPDLDAIARKIRTRYYLGWKVMIDRLNNSIDVYMDWNINRTFGVCVTDTKGYEYAIHSNELPCRLLARNIDDAIMLMARQLILGGKYDKHEGIIGKMCQMFGEMFGWSVELNKSIFSALITIPGWRGYIKAEQILSVPTYSQYTVSYADKGEISDSFTTADCKIVLARIIDMARTKLGYMQ